MYKIAVFIPEAHLEGVKQAMFDAGGGRIGDYDQCSWQVLGQGQFRPLSGSQPFLGEQGQLERVNEYKLEMVCSDMLINKVLLAMKVAHPYEEVAYEVYSLEDL